MYALDTNAAKKADSIGGSIREIGKYIGVFTQAEDIVAASGTKGIALNFDSNGQKARLSLYTIMKDGKKIMGFDTLMAILTCMKVSGIKPVDGIVTGWDFDNNVETKKPGKIFPELCGKPIGLLLETEDYEDRNGAVKTRMALKGVFNAETEFTASEIIDRKTVPEQLPRMVAALRHHPLKGVKAQTASYDHSTDGGDVPDQRMPWDE
jgi:hypothetical protein